MFSAKQMLEKRFAAIRLDCDTEVEAAMEVDLFVEELASELGTLLRHGLPERVGGRFGYFVLRLSAAYLRDAEADQPPIITSFSTLSETTLSRAELAGYENRMRRVNKGLTQRQLGALVGLSPATISRWELGRFNPTPAEAEKLRCALSDAPMQPALKGIQ